MNGEGFQPDSRHRAPPVPGHAPAAARSGTGRLPALLLVAALLATGGAVFVIAVSKIAPHPVGASAADGDRRRLSFVGTGVVALRLQPYARFGLLLCAVGFTSLISALHEANGAFAYTVGVLASNLVFAVLLHAFLAFPSGRLGSTGRRAARRRRLRRRARPAGARRALRPAHPVHSDHPRNLVLVDSRSSLATGLEELEAAIAIALALAAVLVLSRRARAATPAARRQLVPVLIGGTVALPALLRRARPRAALVARRPARVRRSGWSRARAAGRVPRARSCRDGCRGARSGELLLELRDPAGPADLAGRLRRALGDPSLRARPAAAGGGPLPRLCRRDRSRCRARATSQVATPILPPGGAGRRARPRPLLAPAAGAARRGHRRGRLRARQRACSPRPPSASSSGTAPCSTRSPTRCSASP